MELSPFLRTSNMVLVILGSKKSSNNVLSSLFIFLQSRYNIYVCKYFVWTMEFFNCWRIKMGVSYKKLWVKIAEKEMKKTDLKDEIGISSNTLAKLGKNEYISLEIIDRICRGLNCDIGDVVEITKNNNLEDE